MALSAQGPIDSFPSDDGVARASGELEVEEYLQIGDGLAPNTDPLRVPDEKLAEKLRNSNGATPNQSILDLPHPTSYKRLLHGNGAVFNQSKSALSDEELAKNHFLTR